MMLITHIGFGLLLGLLALRLGSLPVNRHLFIAAVVLASILPDLDSGTSLIGKRLRIRSLFFRHRGMIHSLVFMAGFSALFFLITGRFYYSLAFAAGYLSHLLLDSMTPSGVAFFWPGRNRTKGAIRTTGIWDFVILSVLLALDVLLLA